MPFKSQKQRSFLYSKHPDIAKKWTKEYPEQTQLPEEADPMGQEADAMAEATETDPVKLKRNRRMGRLKKVIEGPSSSAGSAPPLGIPRK